MDLAATALRITAATTIPARYYLGAHCIAGTLLVDRGGAPNAAKRLANVPVSTRHEPHWPIHTEDEAGAPHERSRIHCSGATDAIIYFSL